MTGGREPSHSMPQLDGLRAFAILIVCGAHLLAFPWLSSFRTARLGVVLFFLLSGFLITGILLKEHRSKDERRILVFNREPHQSGKI